MSKPRVAIHIDQNGNIGVYHDEGVDVFQVSELAPNDRVYRYTRDPIPDGLLDGPFGHLRDGSAAHARVTRAVREAYGLPIFDVIGEDA